MFHDAIDAAGPLRCASSLGVGPDDVLAYGVVSIAADVADLDNLTVRGDARASRDRPMAAARADRRRGRAGRARDAARGAPGQRPRGRALPVRGLRRDQPAPRLLRARHRRARAATPLVRVAPRTGRCGHPSARRRMADQPLVLGIETSCDETGVGLVRGQHAARRRAGQQRRRARPLRRRGARRWPAAPTSRRWCRRSSGPPRRPASGSRDVDAVAVTAGPGLAGALLVGVAAAKALAYALGKPIYGVNHLAAHVAVDRLEHGDLPRPSVAMLVSGGHSSLLLVEDLVAGVRAARRHDRRRGRRGVRQGGPAARPAVPGWAGDRPAGARRRPRVRHVPARPHRAAATRPSTGSTSRSPG